MPRYRPTDFGGGGGFIKKKKPKFCIYVVIHEFYENLPILQPLIATIENFGRSLSNDANVILPHNGGYAQSRQDVLSLDWDDCIRKLLIQEKKPYFLVISCDISEFKPNIDDFAIIKLPCDPIGSNMPIDILFELQHEIKTKEYIAQWKYSQNIETAENLVVSSVINTNGGATIQGDVNASEFIGRDKILTEINIYLHPRS